MHDYRELYKMLAENYQVCTHPTPPCRCLAPHRPPSPSIAEIASCSCVGSWPVTCWPN